MSEEIEKGKWQTWAEGCHADIELLKAVKEKGLTLKEIEDYSRAKAIGIGKEIRSQLMQHGLKLELIDGHPIVTKIEEWQNEQNNQTDD